MNKIKFPTKVGSGPAEVNKATYNSAVIVDISDAAKTLSVGFGKKE
ncbi:MAG: hypothetical protein HC836_45110 [Richelia sp. RM2_1_2]|nr:hypothetical protein [Richelia sp. RM2_1_2]